MMDSLERHSHEPLKILCVDDNIDAADSLGEMLSMAGHRVSVCHDGTSALAKIEAGYRPDVCVFDISMPGVDGYQLASKLRSQRDEKDLLLVAATALGDYRALEEMANAGFDLHFTKPVPPESLYEVLHERAARLAERDSARRVHHFSNGGEPMSQPEFDDPRSPKDLLMTRPDDAPLPTPSTRAVPNRMAIRPTRASRSKARATLMGGTRARRYRPLSSTTPARADAIVC